MWWAVLKYPVPTSHARSVVRSRGRAVDAGPGGTCNCCVSNTRAGCSGKQQELKGSRQGLRGMLSQRRLHGSDSTDLSGVPHLFMLLSLFTRASIPTCASLDDDSILIGTIIKSCQSFCSPQLSRADRVRGSHAFNTRLSMQDTVDNSA